jgi:hypothetical protein
MNFLMSEKHAVFQEIARGARGGREKSGFRRGVKTEEIFYSKRPQLIEKIDSQKINASKR